MPLLFLVPIVVGLATQALKRVFNKEWRLHKDQEDYLPRYGGMPSAHTAFAFSLATVVAVYDGFDSTMFAIVAAVLIFVLDDALRMRIFLGHHGQALHRFIQRLPLKERSQYPQVETHLGHKPAEVTVGAILGVVLTLLILFFLRAF